MQHHRLPTAEHTTRLTHLLDLEHAQQRVHDLPVAERLVEVVVPQPVRDLDAQVGQMVDLEKEGV